MANVFQIEFIYFFVAEKTTKFWKASAQFTLQQQLAKQYINGTAKNVIFFLGDGMSIPTITAARIYSGQLQGQRGEEAHLAFDRFPFTGFAKVETLHSMVNIQLICHFTHMRTLRTSRHIASIVK